MNTNREHWLNGWHRTENTVFVFGCVRCAGCGRDFGVTCWIAEGDLPEKEPDWPFDAESCPLCTDRDKVQEQIELAGIATIARCIEKNKGMSSVALAREIVAALGGNL